MNSKRNLLLLLTGAILLFLFSVRNSQAQSRAERAFREYVNPDELVAFDRTTEFSRALDVINDFSQKQKGKIILDRTGTTGSIGISIPMMHWQDALDLILNVKGLRMVERKDFFEILQYKSLDNTQATAAGSQETGSSGGAEELIVTTDTREVRINAIFFEGNRRALQELGIDWSTLSEGVPETVSDYVTDDGSGEFPTTEFDGPFVQVNSKGAQTVSQNVFNALVNFGEMGNSGISVQALFSAFEADNLGEILASPSIKVMEGEEGNIQVGQDFSIKQRDIAGNVMDEFVSVGTILTVTPNIFSAGDTTFIHLDIEAERSSAQPDPVSTVVNKTEAQTQAILLNGESTVIAGLYRTEFAEVRRGIPILKDLPPWFFGLRYLFGYNSKDYLMRELIIIVQASIEPTIPERFAQQSFPSKFEVLRDERIHMREEMLEQKKMSREVDNPANLNSDSENSTQDTVDKPIKKENVRPKDDPFASRANKNDSNEEDQTQEQKPVNNQLAYNGDPELDNGPIPLDFSPDTSDETLEDDHSGNSLNINQPEPEEVKKKPADNKEPKKGQSDNRRSEDTDQKITSSAGYVYYIIGGSFRNKENARKLKNELLAEGFDAIILNRAGSDMHSVAYRGYNDLGKAQAAINDIRKYQNPKAWLYKVQ